ncbi:MAG: 7-cyano-7-deazaguanine synthase QueC, partial [Bacteroides sp.]
MNTKKAVVLFSGGQDSTTCLYWAKERFDEVVAISFSYGQKHSNEVEIARELAAQAGVHFEVMNAHYISQLSINALTDTSLAMEEDNDCPNTFVPGRNLFFLSMVAVYAYEHQIQHIVTGVSQTDYSGYPDCRHNFIQSANLTLNLAMDREFVLHAP